MKNIATKMRHEYGYSTSRATAATRWSVILNGIAGGISPEEIREYLYMRLYVAAHNPRHHAEYTKVRDDYAFACKLCGMTPIMKRYSGQTRTTKSDSNVFAA